MLKSNTIEQKVRGDLESKNVDLALTESILKRLNEGSYQTETATVSEIPAIDNREILDLAGELFWSVKTAAAMDSLHSLDLDLNPAEYGVEENGTLNFDRRQLREIGVKLLPFYSYGILNGGSATSYADEKKNESFNGALFALYRDIFFDLSERVKGKAKGLTPAFYQPSGEEGPSFIELKMRSLLLLFGGKKRSQSPVPIFPLFQMTSSHNNTEVLETYDRYRDSPYLKPLNDRLGINCTEVKTAIQPLTAAFSREGENDSWSVFDAAYGKKDSTLPLPGGHGQCFAVLRPVLESLYETGKRFIQIGNVDNIGNTVDPVALAILCLSGRPAGFDFAFRTPVDTKGGILVRDDSGRLNCVDIGPAISKEDVLAEEQRGHRILFNCATGIFNLKYLLDNIDRIIESLPLRLSFQSKDSGEYYQAEQITWEVIGLLKNPIVFGVDKYRRFLAAKLLVETMLTSGIRLTSVPEEIKPTAEFLNRGLAVQLTDVYGMNLDSARWQINKG